MNNKEQRQYKLSYMSKDVIQSLTEKCNHYDNWNRQKLYENFLLCSMKPFCVADFPSDREDYTEEAELTINNTTTREWNGLRVSWTFPDER